MGSGGPGLESGLFFLQKVLYTLVIEREDSRGNSIKNNALVFRAAHEAWKKAILLRPESP